MCLNKLICFLCCALTAASVAGQDGNMNALDSFSAKIITNIRANEKQRAYLVTDKSVFRAGEYIWFRAFLLNTVSHKLSSRSKFLFVDIVNDKDIVIKRVILDPAGNQLNSRIKFPDSLPTGYYWLRAYTRQMAEADTNDVSVKPLFVFGQEDNARLAKPKKNTINPDEAPSISFYAEGGNIITGINSTIALMANDKNGAPVRINGYVKDNRDTVVARFSSDASGLGKFDFEASGFRQYKAVIDWKGKEISYALPSFDFYAGQLSVSRQPGGYKLRILLGDSIYSKDAVTYVVGISKDSLVFAGIGKGQYEVFIDEQKLPRGVAGFYLFDKNFKLLSERSIYVNSNTVHVDIATGKNTYAKRDIITFSLSVTDSQQHVIPSLLAVSVSDSLFDYNQGFCNFNSAGFNPAVADNLLFADSSCLNEDDIDLKMLIKNNTYQTFASPAAKSKVDDRDSLLYIKGVVSNAKNEPLANHVVSIISKTGDILFNTDTTDNAGRFSFPLDSYFDSTQFAMEVRTLNGVTHSSRIVLDAPAYPELKTPVALKKYFEPETKLINQRISTYYKTQWADAGEPQLPPVTVKDERKQPDYDVSKRVSQYSPILTSKDLDGRTTVDMAILRISGLQLLNGYLVIRGLNSMNTPGPASEPLLLVEGAQVALSSDNETVSPVMNYLHSLNPKDVDFIEVLKDGNAAAYGVRGANGVILVNLLHRQRDIYTGESNMQTFYVDGITRPVMFPNFNSDKKDKKAQVVNDNRSTLFWNGNLVTGDTGKATFSFYTSDIPSTYTVNITGITQHGDIIHKTINFQTK